jgi:hypothetical protein
MKKLLTMMLFLTMVVGTSCTDDFDDGSAPQSMVGLFDFTINYTPSEWYDIYHWKNGGWYNYDEDEKLIISVQYEALIKVGDEWKIGEKYYCTYIDAKKTSRPAYPMETSSANHLYVSFEDDNSTYFLHATTDDNMSLIMEKIDHDGKKHYTYFNMKRN